MEANFVGTGDLFAALSIAWFDKSGGDLKVTLEKVISTMNSVLKRTLESALRRVPQGVKPTSGDLELKLIQSKDDISSPDVRFHAQEV